MIVIREDSQQMIQENLVATIGFFDGVHVGHRFLIQEVKEEAHRRGLPSAVITFDRHPRSVLQADYRPALLTTLHERLHLLSQTGIDYCIVLNFSTELSHLSAEEFITFVLAEQYRIKALLIGHDHRFGYNRSDGFEQYQRYGRACGMAIIQAQAYQQDHIQVSSSVVRRSLMEGKVEEAARLLSYPYTLSGIVVRGFQLGRTLGFPTANIQPLDSDKIIPAQGVYMVRVTVKGKIYTGMLSVGNRPTVNNGEHITIEVYILDFDDQIYTEELSISFLYHLRENRRFDNQQDLKAQLQADLNRVKSLRDTI